MRTSRSATQLTPLTHVRRDKRDGGRDFSESKTELFLHPSRIVHLNLKGNVLNIDEKQFFV